MKKHTIVGLGELLWDMLPSGPQLGGAPANFAYYASLLGNQGIVASCVGDDDLGVMALQRIEQLGLSTGAIQQDQNHPTGTVDVTVDVQGQPDFIFKTNVAWEHMAWTTCWAELAAQTDVVCFGSMAQYDTASSATIGHFLEAMRPDALRIFDVNLREALFSADVLSDSMKKSDLVKLNDDELPRICVLLGIEGNDLKSQAERLLSFFALQMVCITRGAKGSLLISSTELVDHPGISVNVADTVGAGDAFTAVLADGYVRKKSLHGISEAANHLGAWVASQTGATQKPDDQILAEIHRLFCS
jgi:fructokinase